MVDNVSVLSRLEQGLPSSTGKSLNKVICVGAGVYVLKPPSASPTCGQSL